MIRLHQFPPAYGLPNGSPFCMKVENYLRMTGIPYEVVDDFDLAKAPKGKLPYIEDAERVIADSALILDYLKAAYGDPLDAHPHRIGEVGFPRLHPPHGRAPVLGSRYPTPVCGTCRLGDHAIRLFPGAHRAAAVYRSPCGSI